ncbi:hypothetical protein [Paraburkholderia sp. CNPSo 3076]|uniref:hypothetical protein n=1 Tax=Paraburkholderia sp. CNPSo 3076 TaxID=2940936 RepID=UPI002B1DBC73|nr:hypothetical protein [Paraburkholderia sp. CNPSo 3076]
MIANTRKLLAALSSAFAVIFLKNDSRRDSVKPMNLPIRPEFASSNSRSAATSVPSNTSRAFTRSVSSLSRKPTEQAAPPNMAAPFRLQAKPPASLRPLPIRPP